MENISNKNRLTALLLCWFIGVFGAHRFYVKKTGSAVVMLLLSLTGVGLVITAVWVFIDFVTIAVGGFTDANDYKVTNWK